MEDIDFGKDAEKLGKKWMPAIVVIAGLLFIGIIAFVGMSVISSPPVAMSFANSKISAGGNTVLKVVVFNSGEADATSVLVTVTAEAGPVTITANTRVEPTIGSKARREFEFPVGVAATATKGTYKLTATVKGINEKDQTANAYIEVA